MPRLSRAVPLKEEIKSFARTGCLIEQRKDNQRQRLVIEKRNVPQITVSS